MTKIKMAAEFKGDLPDSADINKAELPIKRAAEFTGEIRDFGNVTSALDYLCPGHDKFKFQGDFPDCSNIMTAEEVLGFPKGTKLSFDQMCSYLGVNNNK